MVSAHQERKFSNFKYYSVIGSCVIISIICFFSNNIFDLKSYDWLLCDYEICIGSGNYEEHYKWIIENRFENYQQNIENLHAVLADIVLVVVLGMLLILFKPNGIKLSFISLNVPEGLLYLVVVFGGIYVWQRFGLELNAAIDSRLSLKFSIQDFFEHDFFRQLGDQHEPRHLLIDNAIIDNWMGVYFSENNIDEAQFAWMKLGLFGLYGTLSGLLYAVIFVSTIELGYRKKTLSKFSALLIIFSIGFFALANYAWLKEHPYSNKFLGYYWLASAACIFLWKWIGIKYSDVLSAKFKKETNNQ